MAHGSFGSGTKSAAVEGDECVKPKPGVFPHDGILRVSLWFDPTEAAYKQAAMGFAISWLAFEHLEPEKVHNLLALQPTGETSEVAEAMFNGATLPNGWYLVLINETDHAYLQRERLAAFSAGGRVIAVSVEEHVMVCWASEWRNGQEEWTVTHSSEEGPEHLDESGQLPETYAAIRSRSIAEQAAEDANGGNVDYLFNVPLELARSIVGYSHDEATDVVFETLEPRASEKRGLLGRLFG